ncbi:MAG: hypothetical protein JOZ72_02130 [Alphaproteobacteria bacterium]|nr:hypothetical protein [Alphaproteobacteria bacterium]
MDADEKICPRCAETVKMAAKVCKHCGYEFPASEQPVPAPGSPAPQPASAPQPAPVQPAPIQPTPAQPPAPAQPPMPVTPRPYSPPPQQMTSDPPAKGRTLFIVLAAILGVIVVLAIIGLAVGPQDGGDAKQAVNAGTSTSPGSSSGTGSGDTGDAGQGAAQGDNSGGSEQADATAVSSVELARAYNANEVNAQNTYGGKTLDVTGTITGVKLDIFNNPVVEMEGVNEFLPVQATFDQSYSQKVSALSKGQEITVRCTSITEVISAPMLSECSLPE